MKKFLIWLCIGALTFGMVSCGDQDAGNDDTGTQTEEPAAPSDTPTEEPGQDSQDAPTEEHDQDSQDVSTDGNAAGGHDYSQGWTEEMEAVKKAVLDLLGENYFPNMPLDPEMLEYSFGITANMFEDYLAELPMISANVDTLVVVKAAEGQIDAVEAALNGYRDAQVSNTMQYPQNVGKIQASKVERIGNYVIFTLLGGDLGDLLDQGDEVVITHCQEVNDSVIEAIKGVLQ